MRIDQGLPILILGVEVEDEKASAFRFSHLPKSNDKTVSASRNTGRSGWIPVRRISTLALSSGSVYTEPYMVVPGNLELGIPYGGMVKSPAHYVG
ncbi:unnamed protein product [Sphagnum troendelagicum]|uniref:Uncharacterized protein n=1 Tax=Sphagnum troendelagicum TaxID=128251 RepID=A0ABP0UHB2_9BRYO